MAHFWKHCPICAHKLEWQTFEHGIKLLACPDPHLDDKGRPRPFVDWNNPIPVVALVVPWRRKLALVQRAVEPFIGEWCLPAGHVNQFEHPHLAGKREGFEEIGIGLDLVAFLTQCTPQIAGRPPMNSMLNFYLARPESTVLKFGDDAQDARWFTRSKMPKLCFPTHQLIADAWFAGRLGNLRHPRPVIDIDTLAKAD